MDLTAVLAKTPRGIIEIKTRSAALTPAMRRVLIMADGKRSLADLVPFVQPHDIETLATALVELQMISFASGGDADARVDDASAREVPALATVSGETTTAQRPAVLRLTLPASDHFVERPGAGPPTLRDTIEANWPLARDLSFAVAGAPRATSAIDAIGASATERSPASALLLRADVDELPEDGPREPAATIATSTRLRNSVAPRAANGAGAAPTRSSAVVNPAPAGKASATSTESLLEESKRLAVRALFERLGPYGEAPAAKIQECTSLEALHEQVQQAVRRIASFRGERAAQEFLLMLAQP